MTEYICLNNNGRPKCYPKTKTYPIKFTRARTNAKVKATSRSKRGGSFTFGCIPINNYEADGAVAPSDTNKDTIPPDKKIPDQGPDQKPDQRVDQTVVDQKTDKTDIYPWPYKGPDKSPDITIPDKGPDILQPDKGPDKEPDITVPDVGPDKGPDFAVPDKGPDKGPDVAVPDVGPDQTVYKDITPPDVGKPDKGFVCTTAYNSKNFSTGTSKNIDNWALPGSLLSKRSWYYCWHASSGTLPGTPFALENPAGGTVKMTTDPQTKEPALLLDGQTKNINTVLKYKWVNPGIKNVNGSALLMRGRQHSSDRVPPHGSESSIEIFDDSMVFGFGLAGKQALDGSNNTYVTFDTTTKSNTYTGEVKNNAYKVYVNEGSSPLLSGVKKYIPTEYRVGIGDTGGTPDGVFYINDFCIHPTTSTVPIASGGSHEIIYNLGNFVKSAKISSTGSTKDVTVEAYVSSNGSSWTKATVSTSGEISSTQSYKHIKIKFLFSSAKISRLDGYKLEYCTYK